MNLVIKQNINKLNNYLIKKKTLCILPYTILTYKICKLFKRYIPSKISKILIITFNKKTFLILYLLVKTESNISYKIHLYKKNFYKILKKNNWYKLPELTFITTFQGIFLIKSFLRHYNISGQLLFSIIPNYTYLK